MPEGQQNDPFIIPLSLTSCIKLSSFQPDLPLPSQCPANSTNMWWKPLESGGKDPCELNRQLQLHGVHIGCCSTQSGMASIVPRVWTQFAWLTPHTGMSSRMRRRRGSCGPCNLQTYNIAVACDACTLLHDASSPTAVQNAIGNNSLSSPRHARLHCYRHQFLFLHNVEQYTAMGSSRFKEVRTRLFQFLRL